MIFMNDIQFSKRVWHLDELFRLLQRDPAGFIADCCHAYQQRIQAIAAAVAADPHHKIIMLSGPSGSGKTTTAGYLRQALEERYAIHSAVVSLDDFYLGLGKAPLLPNGDYDYESVHALNVPLLQQCLLSLAETGSCLLPQFDFAASRPKQAMLPITLRPGDLILFEGIHALNPLILGCLPRESIIKMYVSVETTVYGDGDVLIPPREIRLARRLVRDSIYRGADACRTLQMWTGVMQGEDQYLFPYKEDVDYTISTFHEFEPAVLKPFLLPLLQRLPPDTPNADWAADLLADYQRFPSIDPSDLPQDCLIHEFIG